MPDEGFVNGGELPTKADLAILNLAKGITTYYLLLTTCYLLLTTYYLLLTTYYLPPTTYYLLLNTLPTKTDLASLNLAKGILHGVEAYCTTTAYEADSAVLNHLKLYTVILNHAILNHTKHHHPTVYSMRHML